VKLQPFRQQRGAALLVMALILVLGFSSFLISALSKSFDRTTYVRNRNSEVLQKAKEALIGYVAKEVLDLSENVPGRLPCPESPSDAGTDNEGRAGSSCDPGFPTNKNIGRLPWRTLGLDKLVDASSEPLWYAVSPNWVLSGSTPVINSGTPGQLTVDGTGDVVAVIIAPGKAVNATPDANQQAACGSSEISQSRNDRGHDASSSVNPDYRNYLECQNASSPIDLNFGVSVQDNASNEVLNDQVVFVTARDILNAIQGPLAERLQRTVAPLLNEHADKWIAASGQKFLPYAVSLAALPSPETTTVKCGTASLREGVIPTALTTTSGCSSTWENFTITGTSNGVVSQGCSGTSTVTCTFRYYTLNALGALLNFVLNLLGLSSLVGNVGNAAMITATISADAPNAALSFRDPLEDGSIVVTNSAGPALSHTMSLAPKVTGEVNLTIQIPITSGTNNLCTSIVGLVCNLLPGALATANTVTVQFPELADATVAGTQLASAVFPSPHTLSLLTPVDGDPHYWFMSNEWYRYTYYAVAPTVSAAQSGGFLTVSGFPAANGSPSDKRFVLAVAGPAVIGQNARPSTSVDQYFEGENKSTGDDTFAYQVYSASGNDRVATCPFSVGSSPVVSVCD
jgi:hypothetical protein